MTGVGAVQVLALAVLGERFLHGGTALHAVERHGRLSGFVIARSTELRAGPLLDLGPARHALTGPASQA